MLTLGRWQKWGQEASVTVTQIQNTISVLGLNEMTGASAPMGLRAGVMSLLNNKGNYKHLAESGICIGQVIPETFGAAGNTHSLFYCCYDDTLVRAKPSYD